MADNAVRQEWNRTADLALVSGVEKEKILQIKQAEIKDKTRQSVQQHGWLPDLLRTIIKAAIQFLKQLIPNSGAATKTCFKGKYSRVQGNGKDTFRGADNRP